MKPLTLTTTKKPGYEAKRVTDIKVNDKKPWYHDIKNYLEHGEFLEGVVRKTR